MVSLQPEIKCSVYDSNFDYTSDIGGLVCKWQSEVRSCGDLCSSGLASLSGSDSC